MDLKNNNLDTFVMYLDTHGNLNYQKCELSYVGEEYMKLYKCTISKDYLVCGLVHKGVTISGRNMRAYDWQLQNYEDINHEFTPYELYLFDCSNVDFKHDASQFRKQNTPIYFNIKNNNVM